MLTFSARPFIPPIFFIPFFLTLSPHCSEHLHHLASLFPTDLLHLIPVFFLSEHLHLLASPFPTDLLHLILVFLLSEHLHLLASLFSTDFPHLPVFLALRAPSS